jgi:hypothetical protein
VGLDGRGICCTDSQVACLIPWIESRIISNAALHSGLICRLSSSQAIRSFEDWNSASLLRGVPDSCWWNRCRFVPSASWDGPAELSMSLDNSGRSTTFTV